MTVSRKHFEAVARIVRDHRLLNPDPGFDEGYDSAAASIRSALADYFELQNPNFDRERFIAACDLPR